MKLNHTGIRAIDPSSGWLAPGTSHHTGDVPGGPPAVPSLWSVSSTVCLGCIPDGLDRRKKSTGLCEVRQPVGGGGGRGMKEYLK